MFKKVVSLGAATALASVAMASAASAHVPAGTYTLNTASGQQLAVKHSVNLECQATLTLVVNATGHAGSITGGSFLAPENQCGNVGLKAFNWPVTIGSFSTSGANTSATFQVTGVGANTLLGSCNNGTLNGTIVKNSTTGTTVVNITSSTGWTSSPLPFLGCGVTGALTVSPSPAISVP